jgi:hypothetical protein
MNSIKLSVNYYANPGGFDTPDFNTELTIYSDGTFKTTAPYNENGTIRSWLHEIYPSGANGLTIVVNSHIAQFYDKIDADVLQVVSFLEKYLKNIQTTNSDLRWTPGV